MSQEKINQRKFDRYDTEVKIYFQVTHELETKVEFQITKDTTQKKYTALSRNISAQGIGFTSSKKLSTGDILVLELYLPSKKDPMRMEGQVCWSKEVAPTAPTEFNTGVKILSVEGKTIDETIYFDEKYKIVWSELLESVLGNFRTFAKQVR